MLSWIAEASFFLQRRGKLLSWVAGQSGSRSQLFFGKRCGANKLFGTRCHYEEGRRPIVGFAVVSLHEKNEMNGSESGQQETMHNSRPIDELSPTIHARHSCLALQCQIPPSIILTPRVSFEVDSEIPLSHSKLNFQHQPTHTHCLFNMIIAGSCTKQAGMR